MRICLFEDHRVIDLEPLTLTRPVFDLRCGLSTLADKHARYFASCSRGAVVRPFLADWLAERHPDLAVNDSVWLRHSLVAMVNGRWLPPDDARGTDLGKAGPCVGTVGGEVAWAVVNPDRLAGCTHANLEDLLALWKATLPHREAGGTLLARPWELIDHNADQIVREFRSRPASYHAGGRPLGCALVGRLDRLWIDPAATVDPMVVIDVTGGPVVVDGDAHVGAFTRLEGPCHVAAGARLMGAKVRAGTSVGPCCRVGGEVEASILQGFANKYHDGFLGHSYVGDWVNIGAGAHTSDLRLDYGEIVMPVGGRKEPTGHTKLGSLIGDHTKVGIGTLLNTGSTIGAFAHLLPSGTLLPRYVPSFCTVSHGALAETGAIDALFATAAEAMRRRGVHLTEAQREVYRRAYDQTAMPRHQAVRDADPRRQRRAA